MNKLYLEHTKLLELKGNIQTNLEHYKSDESWVGQELSVVSSNSAQLKVTDIKNVVRMI